jgi:hypothetical protein
VSKRSGQTKDGRTVEYVEVPDPPMGGMKKVYFSPDRSYVVAFFHDPQAAADANRHARLDAVLGRFNPTTDPEAGEYWKKLFCWPTGVLTRPGTSSRPARSRGRRRRGSGSPARSSGATCRRPSAATGGTTSRSAS